LNRVVEILGCLISKDIRVFGAQRGNFLYTDHFEQFRVIREKLPKGFGLKGFFRVLNTGIFLTQTWGFKPQFTLGETTCLCPWKTHGHGVIERTKLKRALWRQEEFGLREVIKIVPRHSWELIRGEHWDCFDLAFARMFCADVENERFFHRPENCGGASKQSWGPKIPREGDFGATKS